MGSPQTLHTRSRDTAASVARQYSLTRRTYGTEAVSVISTLREIVIDLIYFRMLLSVKTILPI